MFAILLCPARTADGQTLDRVEVMAFGGYRFGGEFYEIASERPVDTDGAPAFGAVLNIPFTRETQIEALIRTSRRASRCRARTARRAHASA